MRIPCPTAPVLALCLLGLPACGPRDAGRSTTPRTAGEVEDPGARPGHVDPRRAPPAKVAHRTPPRRAAPTTMRCPTSRSVALRAVIWPAAQAHLRRYNQETRLDKVATTKASPVEVCSARGQVAWLLRARCPDGSAPFADARRAHRSRKGSVGPGGRCGNIVDLYQVPCGGTVIAIHMSLYHCTPGQRFP